MASRSRWVFQATEAAIASVHNAKHSQVTRRSWRGAKTKDVDEFGFRWGHVIG